jgi:hypothetical protein
MGLALHAILRPGLEDCILSCGLTISPFLRTFDLDGGALRLIKDNWAKRRQLQLATQACGKAGVMLRSHYLYSHLLSHLTCR